MKNIILKYSGILLFMLLLEWWIIFFSPLDIPRFIPGTPIDVNGLLLIITLITVLILLTKRLLLFNPAFSMWRLTLVGTLICFVAEAIFQLIRQPTLETESFEERMGYFLNGVLAVTLFSCILSFFIAFQIKTKRTGLLIAFVILFLVLFKVIAYLFFNQPLFEK